MCSRTPHLPPSSPAVKPAIFPSQWNSIFPLGSSHLSNCPWPLHSGICRRLNKEKHSRKQAWPKGLVPFLSSVLGTVLIWPFGSESAWVGSLRAAVLPPQHWLSPNWESQKRGKEQREESQDSREAGLRIGFKDKAAPGNRVAFTGLSGLLAPFLATGNNRRTNTVCSATSLWLIITVCIFRTSRRHRFPLRPFKFSISLTG